MCDCYDCCDWLDECNSCLDSLFVCECCSPCSNENYSAPPPQSMENSHTKHDYETYNTEEECVYPYPN